MKRKAGKMSKRYVYVKRRYVFLFALVDTLGYFIRGIFRVVISPKHHIAPNVTKITVIELAHLGDVLAATPAIRLLKKKFPAACITCVVSPWSEDIISGNPDIDEIIIYRASWFDRIDKKPFSLKETIAFIKQLRQKRFDIGIDMRGDVRVIFLMWLAGIKYRVGYAFTGGGFLLSNAVFFDAGKKQGTHQIDHNINLIKAIDFGKDVQSLDRRMTVSFSESDKSYIEGYLKANAVVAGDFLIAVHPGAGLAAKRWPVERFNLLIDRILEGHRVKIVLVGGPYETDLAKRFSAKMRTDVVNAIGSTTIKQLAALLKRCSLFIGADSGIMHIVSAVEIPMVIIWSGNAKTTLWGPLSQGAVVIDKPLEAISVEDVLKEVSRSISGRAARTRSENL